MSVKDRIRVKNIQLLSDGKYKLRKTTFDWRRSSGDWQTQHRETFDRGDGVAILPYNLAQRTVLLIRQFRYPTYANGYDDLLVEVPAGSLDNAEPEARVRSETEEEIGYRLGPIQKVFEAFTSPGAVTEKLYLFVAGYQPDMKIGNGGGLAHEGEDIETLELPFTDAFAMIADGRIVDAKTIMLLQYAALNIFGQQSAG
ncbi:NUDIX domain-containing protein [Bradyrhizobium sp. G127]|jgi:nudix-type nucleoside diphosphatase (YffH/AdpP family)|uniref:NUDIX domain-containing protein n=1 Tax=Bradyrhizobium sp. G127 TaxID=2904800 RepID=UPI001F16998C|nr:NUDIX domain-containing protein [Bradyrhizobium sp. G127]MCF2525586.1 NUDIX domain-containing protein [Bradyrhizobium sp. G127]